MTHAIASSARRAMITASFALTAWVCACAGGGGHTTTTALQPPRTSAVDYPPERRPDADPMLRAAPRDAAVVLHVDVASAWTGPLGALVRQVMATTRAQLPAVCGADPLGQVTDVTLVTNGYASALLVRGPVASSDANACVTALFGSLLGANGPDGGRDAAHPDEPAIFGGPYAASVRAALRSGADPGGNPNLRAARAALAPATLTAIVDAPALVEAAGNDLPSLPPLGRDESQALWHALTATAVGLRADDTALALDVALVFDRGETAARVAGLLTQLWSLAHGALRDQLAEALADPRAAAGQNPVPALLEAVLARPTFVATGAAVHVTTSVTLAELGTLSTAAIPAFVRYENAAKTAEATAHLAYLARAMGTYAAGDAADQAPRPGHHSGHFPPSAPRTPASVPRGVRALDPPGTWDHPTWRALAFALVDPHYYSYEIVSTGRAFTARAYGDLDGNGVLSTFERVGRITPAGRVEISPDLRQTDPLE